MSRSSAFAAVAALTFVVGACSRQVAHPSNVSTEGLPAKVSQPVEFVLASTIGARGTLLAARVFRPSPGLEVVASGLVQSGGVANGEPYPPRHGVTALPAPYRGSTYVALAVGADRPGAYDGLGVVLTWRSDGATHTRYLPLGFRLCVGASRCDSSPVTTEIENLNESHLPRS
jgi:hypothetical protein